MKLKFQLTIITLLIFACGNTENQKKEDIVLSNNPPTNSDTTDTTDNTGNTNDTGIVSCELANLEQEIPTNCNALKYQNEFLSKGEQTANEIILIASRKNKGKKPSRRFDTTITLQSGLHLQVPQTIGAKGSPNSNKKMYIRFNETIDCVWFSKSNVRFEKPKCYVGATRDEDKKTGFLGGYEVSSLIVENVLKIEMALYESSGSDTITTATAELFKN